ncbi:MAG: hypothetical protein A3C07_01520 [Candidatus Sungbacteria bacterium RIFCSPHIGHO2_02_FULL_47_11]|uniref:Uncharacterized protein n=1 Tax=Candidatus Sungbacteria bacterium RIFCSPHIGHO2_02_FULL_47_11 TaxID=1802270 RepID=A0A1G2KFQ2_9BACT|nr:MAG: hypothetical protein A3C07_01520 [Candidatus Sungbacteria bacterium RIFCSPHIGHO2_02_FULL_47_11]
MTIFLPEEKEKTTKEAPDFCDVTEEEIMFLWHSLQTGGHLDENEAWNVVVVGIALDFAFGRISTTANTIH